MATKFNEIGSKTFHVKMVEFEGASPSLEITVGQYKPAIMDATKLHELIEVLQEAERLFGLKPKTSTPMADMWRQQIVSSGGVTIAPFAAGSDGVGKGAQYGL